jgi:hypothetical protein
MKITEIKIADGITPELKRIAREIGEPRRLMAPLGKQLEVDLRAHFQERDARPNARGFPKQHFWSRIRTATVLTLVTAAKAVVTIAAPEFAHKVYGGTITPKRGGALSIPISPEAYRIGSASLFPRPLTQVSRKGKPPLLVETGVIGKSKAWKLHYVLLKSVTHAADPDAWPKPEKLEASLLQRARAVLAVVLRTRLR